MNKFTLYCSRDPAGFSLCVRHQLLYPKAFNSFQLGHILRSVVSSTQWLSRICTLLFYTKAGWFLRRSMAFQKLLQQFRFRRAEGTYTFISLAFLKNPTSKTHHRSEDKSGACKSGVNKWDIGESSEESKPYSSDGWSMVTSRPHRQSSQRDREVAT